MISFIIPAYNESLLLGGTIAALCEAAQGLDYEIIVVDDNSSDETAAIARGMGVRVIQVHKRQIAATRNAGARAAKGELFFFIDADTRVNHTVIAAALDAVRSGAVGGGATVQLDGPLTFYPRLLVAFGNRVCRMTRMAAGCFMFCTRQGFLATGGFDESYYCTEELVFSRALKRCGAFVILQESVLTSGRKLRVYSGWQLITMTTSLLLRGPNAFKQRNGLEFWYQRRSEDSQRSQMTEAE